MSSFQTILPHPSVTDIQTDRLFSNVGAKAIENGFFACEVKGSTLRWLIIEGQDYILQNIGPSRAVRLLIDNEGHFKFQVCTEI